MFRSLFGAIVAGTLTLSLSAQAEVLIPAGATWRYYKGSSTPALQGALNWTQVSYNDGTWGPASPSGFGYGDGDDATVFNDMQNSYVSVFLRRTFIVDNPASINRLTLAVDYDDGFVAFLNGIEIARRNVSGTVTHTTTALNREASRGDGSSNPQEKEFVEINPALLIAGNNVLAISGHNASLTSSDFSLVPELYSNVTLVRGPILQMPTPGQITVTWRTDALTDSAIDYGPDTSYGGGTIAANTPVRNHVVTLPVLPSGTLIRYRVRSGGVTLVESSFTTPADVTQPVRFAVYGDFGWGNQATGVASAGTTGVGTAVNNANPHLTLTVGDNIYDDGQPGNYDPFWFTPYSAINQRAPLFPALGNHDVDNSSNGQPFVDNFYLPQNGPASYTERNYSFDHGDAHFLVIDSNPFVHKVDTVAQSAIKSWVASDLAATSKRWKFVFFHHPAYTSSGTGAHGPAGILQDELQPLFVQHGVNLVFQGHNHFYERINPIGGVHYITTGGGGRSFYSPSIFPQYSAVVRGDVHSFTIVDLAGDLLSLRQIDAAGMQIDTLVLNLEHFRIDGLLDTPTAWVRAGTTGMLRIHAAIRGNQLYLATQDSGEGSDHFIYLNSAAGPMQPANWNKAGQVMQWSAFLADENENGFKGWFDAAGQAIPQSADYTSTTAGIDDNGSAGNGALEGTVNLATHFGVFPAQIHVAAAPFSSANGGNLVTSAQTPAGNGNGNIEATEFLVLNTRDLALDLPTSDAGADQSIEVGMTVILTGQASAPSQLPMSMQWTQLSGPTGSFTTPVTGNTSFTVIENIAAPTDAVLQFRVNDTRFETDDSVVLHLQPMLDSDGDGLSDQEELTGANNVLTAVNPAGELTNPSRADTDGDGSNDGDEAQARTSPNNPGSAFRVGQIAPVGDDWQITWTSVPGGIYVLQRSMNVPDDWNDVGEHVTAASGSSTATDSPPEGAVFYRVRLVGWNTP